jgi:predicted nucleotidyltransferase
MDFDVSIFRQYFDQTDKRQRDVLAAYLFGSLARGRALPSSDVDIAVLLKSGLDAERSVESQLQLEADLERISERPVQVTILNSASPFLAYQVVRDGVLIFERDRSERIAFQVRTLKMYFDLQPRLESLQQAAIKRIKEVGLGKRQRYSTRTLDAARRIHQRLAGTAEG